MKAAVEHIFIGATGSTASYDPTKTILGSLLNQFSGVDSDDNYVSTYGIAMSNIPEITGFSFCYPNVYQWSPDVFWVFLADNAAVAATRRVALYEFIQSSSTLSYKGYITMSGTTITGNKTVRAMRAFVYKHTVGTVSTSGSSTTLNGSSTQFQTQRIAAGARIGFGSTDPTQISQWFEIASITNDTTLVLNTAATVAGGTSYVIEEIRIALNVTNATPTNGGLHLIKGLNFGVFSVGGVTISEASTTDNVRASYLLKDASTTTMTIGAGLGADEPVSDTDHSIYFLNANTTTTMQVFKHNLRAALTVSGGTTTSSFVFKTAVSAALTGTIPQTNNGRLFTVAHGTASGVKSLWFVTTTRIYRTALTSVQDGVVFAPSDFMIEIPPGSSTTYSPLSNFASVDYSSTIDRILVAIGTARFGTYIGQYSTDGVTPFEKIIGANINRLKLSTTSVNMPNALFPQAAQTIWTEGGWFFGVPSVITTGLNWLIAIPFGADSSYSSSTNQFVITPELSTPGASRLYRTYIQRSDYVGDLLPENVSMWFRTTGITANDGSWTAVPINGDMTAFSADESIQFRLAFDTFGEFCIPSKVYSICCVYEDSSQDSHYQPSLTKSSAASRIFAWRQVVAWGSSIPDLQIRMYNASTGFLVLDDTESASASGTFEYSTDGTSWNAWNPAADAVGNYIRYTADSLPNSITVRALLTQA